MANGKALQPRRPPFYLIDAYLIVRFFRRHLR